MAESRTFPEALKVVKRAIKKGACVKGCVFESGYVVGYPKKGDPEAINITLIQHYRDDLYGGY